MSPTDDGTTVRALDTEYQAAVCNHDTATMDRILADDFVLVTGRGRVYTKADLLAEARDTNVVYERQEDSQQTVRVWGDTAVVTALLWAKGTNRGEPFDYQLWFSDTYVRTPGGWRYVLGQASLPLPKASSPVAMKILETERLILRKLSAEDAGFILDLLNQPAFVRFIGDKGVRTVDAARDYILKGPVASYERFGFGSYATELKADHTVIGMCGLVRRDFLDDVDVGYAFLPQFWSQGYAFEAASAVMTYARETLGLKRILAVVSPDNERSINVLAKLGLTFERVFKWPDDGAEVSLYASNG